MEFNHFRAYSVVRKGVEIHVDFERFNPAIKNAQMKLEAAVMNSMIPYMPIQTGSLRQRTQAQSVSLMGTGVVVAAAAPYGRYQYMGKVMVEADTGRGAFYIPTVGWRFHKGAKLVATNRPLTYSNPMATPFWFETAKQNHYQDWVNEVSKALSEGLNGR